MVALLGSKTTDDYDMGWATPYALYILWRRAANQCNLRAPAPGPSSQKPAAERSEQPKPKGGEQYHSTGFSNNPVLPALASRKRGEWSFSDKSKSTALKYPHSANRDLTEGLFYRFSAPPRFHPTKTLSRLRENFLLRCTAALLTTSAADETRP